MLPGIRFLLAAILLSISILIFGLGAAALLRAAHEEVASVPTRRVMPEPVFAQQLEAPTLAMLRVEPVRSEQATDTPPIATPEPAPEAAPVPGVETEKLAALKVDDVPPADAATAEAAAKPVAKETPAPLPAAVESPPPADQEPAALDAAPVRPVEAALVPPEQITPPAASVPVTKTAALGDPATIEKPAEAKKTDEKTDLSELRRQKRAERARERRRAATRRARLASQQAAARQATDPFGQVGQQMPPAVGPATLTTTTRR
ncbi:MAG: hypothetical protein ACRC1G_11460 [Bradyrhizobium sp.]|nr:hypothetical protein [Bradyrhizobium sp.]